MDQAARAALVAHVETTSRDDQEKNRLCRPVPFPNRLEDYATTNIVSLQNQMAWPHNRDHWRVAYARRVHRRLRRYR